ncbi:twin-arginine translocation signal domain-containing protein, partial [Cronobacter sakazakii]
MPPPGFGLAKYLDKKGRFSGMNRRRFIKASLALAAACGTPGLATL